MRYRVTKDCVALNRLWLAGETAVVPDNVKVPVHFAKIQTVAEKVAEAKAAAGAGSENPAAAAAANGQQESAAADNAAAAPAETAADAAAADDDEEELPENLESMNILKLRALAKNRGLDIPKTAKKEEVIAALRGAE